MSVTPVKKPTPRTRTIRVEVPEPGPVELAVEAMPKGVQPIVSQIVADPRLGEGVRYMTGRWSEFSSVTAAIMAGIYAVPEARWAFDEFLDTTWSANRFPSKRVIDADEVVIGAGAQAATYACTRVRQGYPAPLILESQARAGGAFAVTKKPSFFMNSRNRPGPTGLPLDPGTALNVIPGGWVQLSDVTDAEFADNAAMAWVIKANLALSGAKVFLNYAISNANIRTENVGTYYKADYRYLIKEPGSRVRTSVRTRRILWATGLTNEKRMSSLKDPRYVTFMEFMRMMEQPFPLRGMKRVAVIGAGDSGRTAIEALTGKGPNAGMSVPALDWVQEIDWFGVPASCLTKNAWLQTSRTRYKAIAALLPDDNVMADIRYKLSRVKALSKKLAGEALMRSYGGIEIELKVYDVVIDCTGMSRSFGLFEDQYRSGGESGGRRLGLRNGGNEVYAIGPAANFELSNLERNRFGAISENSVALFRYGNRTAQLAQELSGPPSQG